MKPRYIHRSAVTGKFVSAAYAKRYPKRTVRQRVRRCPPAVACADSIDLTRRDDGNRP